MRAFIEINQSQFKQNIKEYRTKYPIFLIAVLKANAYGHGAKLISNICKTLVDMVCVATIEEAIELVPYPLPILILGPTEISFFDLVIENNFIITVYSIEYLKSITEFNLHIHLKINIGMNRIGIGLSQIQSALNIIENSNLILDGIYFHYPKKDSCECENNLIKQYLNLFPKNILIHTGEYNPLPSFVNGVRIGLGLYKNVLTLRSNYFQKRHINTNTPCSYGKNIFTKESGYIYTIPLGYGDGYLKQYYLENTDDYIIGPITMDYLIVFSKNNYPKDHQFLFLDYPIILKLSKKLSLIPYEICTLLNRRLHRKII